MRRDPANSFQKASARFDGCMTFFGLRLCAFQLRHLCLRQGPVFGANSRRFERRHGIFQFLGGDVISTVIGLSLGPELVRLGLQRGSNDAKTSDTSSGLKQNLTKVIRCRKNAMSSRDQARMV